MHCILWDGLATHPFGVYQASCEYGKYAAAQGEHRLDPWTLSNEQMDATDKSRQTDAMTNYIFGQIYDDRLIGGEAAFPNPRRGNDDYGLGDAVDAPWEGEDENDHM